MNPSAQTVLHAYRHLYRQLLRAVQYSTPARYQARDRMRLAFRDQPESKYDATRIARTLEFLEGATKEAGLEHKILKNLLHVQWERRQLGKFAVSGRSGKTEEVLNFRKEAYREYEETIGLLEESMNIYLR